MRTKETAEKKGERRISKIKNGTVIDRVSPGRALEVLKILGILPGTKAKVSFVMNISSLKMPGGKKDIVKIEGPELTENETDKITLISPNATINIIRDYKVAKKYQVELPDVIIDIIKCSRSTCITNNPKEAGIVETKFNVIDREPITLECHHCETQISGNDMLKCIKC